VAQRITTGRSSGHERYRILQAFLDALAELARNRRRVPADIWRLTIAIRRPRDLSSRVLYSRLSCHPDHRLAHWLWGKHRKDFASIAKSFVGGVPDGHTPGGKNRPRPSFSTMPPGLVVGRLR